MSNVPVKQAVQAAIQFRRLHWREAAGVLAALALAETARITAGLAGARGEAGLLMIVTVALSIMAFAALTRTALADEHPGDAEFRPGRQGFQWTRPEWRMVGAAGMVGFLLVLATVIMSFLAILVLSVAGFSAAVKNPESVEAMAKALGPTGQSILFLLFFGFFLGLVYVAIRLSLVPAAIVSRKRISVFDTWGLTKGQFWPLLAATILTNAPSLGLALIISPLTSGPGGVSLPIAVLAAAATGLVGAFIQLPLNVGLTAFLFRGLRPATERPGQGVF